MEKDEVAQVAMQIILSAGNGRAEVKKGLVAMENGTFDEARTRLEQANREIAKAHHAQTDIIQGEAQGEDMPFMILFIHAQDTLMTAKSELNIAERLLAITQNLERRIAALEARDA
jgi:PTS system cellobiose-specific IIA component